MAKIPQIRRLVVEDFQTQKKWIGQLFQPLNIFMETVVAAFNRNLTIRDNLSADLKTVTFASVPTAAAPVAISWTLSSPPAALMVVNVVRTNGAPFTLTGAVQVQWQFTPAGLQITDLVGIVPTNGTQYTLTLLAFTG